MRRFRQTIGKTGVEAVERPTCSRLAVCGGQIAGDEPAIQQTASVGHGGEALAARARLPLEEEVFGGAPKIAGEAPALPGTGRLALLGKVNAAGTEAFSLIEIMMAVGLMTVIMLGLLAMFYQTQRAMRVGSAQVDVMGTGDAAIQMMANELKQLVAAGGNARYITSGAGGRVTNYYPNLEAKSPYLPLSWTRTFGGPQATYLDEIFFLRRENDEWIGTGYFVDPVTDKGGAGVLYRFEWRERNSRSNAIGIIYNEYQKAKTTTVPRMAERIAHLQITAFNADGSNITSVPFTNNYLPSYIDLELGVIEPKPYDRFRARHDSNNVNTPIALAYLTNQLDRLHLFRQRIPIRTIQ